MTFKRRQRPPLVVCHECGRMLTSAGLRMHAGSKKCDLRKIARPMLEATEAETARLEEQGKVSIVSNVAQALERRGLTELTGLVKAETKLFQTDLVCEIWEQWWVDEWVQRIWQKHRDKGYTRSAYTLLERLNEMDQDTRESEIGLIFLEMYA